MEGIKVNRGGLRQSDPNIILNRDKRPNNSNNNMSKSTNNIRFSQDIENIYPLLNTVTGEILYTLTPHANKTLSVLKQQQQHTTPIDDTKRIYLAGSTPYPIVDDDLSQSTLKQLEGYNNYDYEFSYHQAVNDNVLSPTITSNNHVVNYNSSSVSSPIVHADKEFFNNVIDEAVIITSSHPQQTKKQVVVDDAQVSSPIAAHHSSTPANIISPRHLNTALFSGISPSTLPAQSPINSSNTPIISSDSGAIMSSVRDATPVVVSLAEFLSISSGQSTPMSTVRYLDQQQSYNDVDDSINGYKYHQRSSTDANVSNAINFSPAAATNIGCTPFNKNSVSINHNSSPYHTMNISMHSPMVAMSMYPSQQYESHTPYIIKASTVKSHDVCNVNQLNSNNSGNYTSNTYGKQQQHQQHHHPNEYTGVSLLLPGVNHRNYKQQQCINNTHRSSNSIPDNRSVAYATIPTITTAPAIEQQKQQSVVSTIKSSNTIMHDISIQCNNSSIHDNSSSSDSNQKQQQHVSVRQGISSTYEHVDFTISQDSSFDTSVSHTYSNTRHHDRYNKYDNDTLIDDSIDEEAGLDELVWSPKQRNSSSSCCIGSSNVKLPTSAIRIAKQEAMHTCDDTASILSDVDDDNNSTTHGSTNGSSYMKAVGNNLDMSTYSDVNTSAVMTVVTTLSVQQQQHNSSLNDTINTVDHQPKLVIASRKVRKDYQDDIKEIVLTTEPGNFTTIVLTFGNDKDSKLKLRSKSTQTRFDASSSSGSNSGSYNAFQISPSVLDILPHEEKTLYVTFAPMAAVTGVYSGVLKVKAGKKSFVLLLRGEASSSSSCSSCCAAVEEDEVVPAATITNDVPYELRYAMSSSLQQHHQQQSNTRQSWELLDDDYSSHHFQYNVGSSSYMLPPLPPLSYAYTQLPSVVGVPTSSSGSSSSSSSSHCDTSVPTTTVASTNNDCYVLSDGFESTYVQDRQQQVKNWLKKEKSKLSIGGSGSSSSSSSSSSNISNNRRYNHSTRLNNTSKVATATATATTVNTNSTTDSLYFKQSEAFFGDVAIGSLARIKVELCNNTNNNITVYIGDSTLPFVLLHNEIHMKPKSYVRIPVRFVPVLKKQYKSTITAHTSDGLHTCTFVITGNGVY